ncbi:MAG: Helicase associated domain protein [Candidatus Limnocylindrales bacterium]
MATDFRTLEWSIATLASEKARGDAFERAVAHLLRHDPEFGLRRVWGWRDWPGREAAGATRDLGIDLVAEDALGQLIGVQVKFRIDPDRLIRWEDVATAVGYRPGMFSRRLIVTNAWDRGPNAREALGAPGVQSAEPIGWLLRDAFLASEIDWSGALEVGPSGEVRAERHPRTPRPHQLAAIRETVAVLASEPRAQLVMACGSGKTLTTLWIAEARGDRRVLVLVPSLLLLRQFRRDWIESASTPFVDLVVCSDETTVGRDEVTVRTADLGVPVTTEPTDIAAFLAGPGRRVIFATYQSSDRIAQAQADHAIPAFDLVVCDEAHKLAGVQVSTDVRQRDQKVVLDAERIRAGHRLFATATPRLFGPAAKARLELDGADVEIASMDDEALFGPVAHRLSFRSAVEQRILVDYELVVVAVTDAEVADLIDRRAIVRAGALATDAESLAFLVALRRAIAELRLQRSISFHSSVARARAFARWLPVISDEPPVPATGHVAGTMPTGERNRIVERLRSPEVPTLLTTARCLTEGIDVPALDAVAFVDPRGSHVDVVQAVGRAMRTAEGKVRGRVIIPVFLTEADAADPEAAVESSAFMPVLDVLRALRAHDEELSAEATRLRVELGRRSSRLVDSGFLRDHIRVLDVGEGIDLAAFERALDLRSVEVCAVPFEVGLGFLRHFVAREGHASVPHSHVEDNFLLGGWVAHRREAHRAGALARDRVTALEALPGWSWDPIEADWQAGITALRAFATREGHCRPARGYRERGVDLGAWITNRRSDHRRKSLAPDREATLESLPGWSWDPRTADWYRDLAGLRVFAKREGHARVPGDHVEDGSRLGQWVAVTRGAFRRGRLRPERVDAVEAIPGWTWDARDDDWRIGVSRLRAFAEREGHARVPFSHIEMGFKLGSWVNGRRTDHRRDRLSAERTAELEAILGWTWDPLADDWRAGFGSLQRFAGREGQARVPGDHLEAGFPLGTWVGNRRSEFRKRQMPAGHATALESVPGWTWDPSEDDWLAGFAKLAAYAGREGHARVPYAASEDGFPIGAWVTRRRSEHRRGQLAQTRAAALQALPGWTWEPTPDKWTIAMASLRSFVEREGHALVPVKHHEGDFRLGQWVNAQRSAYARGGLSPDRVAALEAIPSWTWQARPRRAG